MLQGLRQPGSYYELCQGAICEVSPLVSEATFIIRGSSPDNRVIKPNGTELALEPPHTYHIRGSGVEIWRVLSPEPGRWRVQSRDPTAELRVSLIQTPAHLELRTAPERPITGEPFTVTARAVNPQGGGVLEMPSDSTQSSLKLEITHLASGEQQTQEVTGLPDAASGVYRFEPPLVAEHAGRHRLKAELVVGNTRFAVGEMNLEVLQPPPPKITIIPVPDEKLFFTEGFRPRMGYPLNIAEPVPMRFKLAVGHEQTKDPVRLEQYFIMPPAVSLVVKLPDPCAESICQQRVQIDVDDIGGQHEVFVRLPSEWQDRHILTVQGHGSGITKDGEPWNEISKSIFVETKRPGWSKYWDMLCMGYWVPWLVLPLVLGSINFADTAWTRPFAPALKDAYQLLGAKPIDRPDRLCDRLAIRRLGGIVWRCWSGYGGIMLYVVAKRWLIFGPLTVRAIPSPASLWRLPWPMVRSVAHQCLLGIRVTQPGTIRTNGLPTGNPPTRRGVDIGRRAV